METPDVVRLIAFPLLTLGLLWLGMKGGIHLLLPPRKQQELRACHWTLQNRAYWNVHLYGSMLRVFANFLMGAVILSLITDTGARLPAVAIILLIILAMLVTVPPFRRFLARLRAAWERIDFSPYRGRHFLTILFILPLLILIFGTIYVPREVSIHSILAIFGLLAILVGWQAWGGIWLSRRTRLLSPAPEKWRILTEEIAGEMGVTPPPRVFVANTAMLNAFAYQTGHAVLYTSPLFEALTKEQIRALAAHELGHLKESRGSHLLRVSHPLVYFPILALNPLLSRFDFAIALLLSLGGFAIASRLYGRFLQRAEFIADAAAPETENREESIHLAEALEVLHRENLVPAILPKGAVKTHPDFYDRLLALGITPDFDRPPAPAFLLMTGLALLYTILCLPVLLLFEILFRWLLESGTF